MPINRRKHRNTSYKKYIIWAIIIALVVLMLISFSPTQHLTEIVLVS